MKTEESKLKAQQEQLDIPVVMISCSKEKLIKGLKEALVGYQKNIGKHECEFEFIQDEDFEEIAQDLIDSCN